MEEEITGLIRTGFETGIDPAPSTTPLIKESYTPRKVMFGDIPVVENIENQIPDDKFKSYEQRFDLLKSLVSSTEDINEQTFLSSRLVYRSVMGLEPESGFFSNEARVLHQALDKVDALDNYSLFVDNTYGMEVLFVNLKATESVMLENREFFGIDNSVQNLSKENIDQVVLNTFNQDNLDNAVKGHGLLSGFPKESVDYYLTNEKHRSPFPIKKLDQKSLDYLQSGTPHWDEERLSQVYNRDYIQVGNLPTEKIKKDRIGIRGYGTAFRTSDPPSKEVFDYCQEMLEIDRRLGVSQFVEDTRNMIKQRKELQTQQGVTDK